MRVLLIEDNEDHVALITEAMDEKYDVQRVGLMRDALEHAALAEFDVILCDLSLPDADGVDNVRRIRDVAPDVPLVVLTSLNDEQAALEALEAGAQDYLAKSGTLLHPTLAKVNLDHAIRYAVQRQQSVSELRESHRLLEEKNQRLAELCQTAERFVDNVSHEFRTPLAVIKEYASLIRDGVVGEVNEKQQRMLEIIDDRSDDLNTMVDDMLDVSKLEAGLLGVCRGPHELAELVDRTMPALARKAAVRNVSLEVDLPDDLPSVWCDSEKAGRVVINLVVNAIKFSGEPGTVRLTAMRDDDRSEVVISVSDNGPGIPEDKLEEIFERFSQPVSSVRQSTKGFGLGLGIAKELADLNLGQMSVTSEPGAGSAFSFSLPYAEPTTVLRRLLKRIRQQKGEGATVCFVELGSATTANERDIRDLVTLFEQGLRTFDQMFSTGADRWIAVLAMSPLEFSDFSDRLWRDHAEISRNRPLGPLPEMLVHHRSSWLLAEHEEAAIVAELGDCLSGREVCYA